MGVFYRRPLAFFSFLFLITALCAYGISELVSIGSMILFISSIILLMVLALIFKKIRMKLIVAAVCIFAVVFALLQSLIFIAIPTRIAQSYEGESTTFCYVIDESYRGEYGRTYTVKVKRIGDNSVDIRASLVCGFDVDVQGGDEIYGYSTIVADGGDRAEEFLTVYMDDAQNTYVRYSSHGRGIIETLFSECGVEILSCRLSDLIKETLYSVLGERSGALAMGFFTGDRSDISADITRDFRRSGVSHLMAVSGSHIAILLGGIELILKKLHVHKNIRCVLLALFGLGFLFITGFSLSAIRSVFMLYAVYIAYFFGESGDSITALFVSISLIVLMFPYSVKDLGLWMSFLATLGLLTAFPVIEEKVPYPRKKPRLLLFVLKVGREILWIAIMTVIANMYLLPIIWYYFGEISLVSIISNILITYPSSLFLLLVPILLLTYKIPLLGILIKLAVSFLADVIIFIVKICSRIPHATYSLKYEFCKYIMIAFAVSIIVLLAIRLKKKIFIILPSGLAAIAFVLCLGFYSIFLSYPSVTYINYVKGQIFAVNDNTSLSVCDHTGGGVGAYSHVTRLLDSSYATEIENYIFTSYSRGNETTLEMLGDRIIIDRIYLPIPQGDSEIINARRLYDMGIERNIDVVFYDRDEKIELNGNIYAYINSTCDGDRAEHIIFTYKGNRVFYITPDCKHKDVSCNTLIVGTPHNKDGEYRLDSVDAKKIYISSVDLIDRLLLTEGIGIFVPEKNGSEYKIEIPFE